MDELRGPNIQIVLHVKEGLGFGFLKSPFVVCGSLNGYVLETDPVVPSHSPVFDAELVWEADKRRFRSLRVQNVPVKVEVFTMGTQGRKDKVGYLLISLLGAQPCPSNKMIDIKHTWHRLLGVRPEGKCCHPQLMLSLSVEDRTNTPTPRNELRMFHSNEVAYLNYGNDPPAPVRSILLSYNEYIAESNKVVTAPELQPKLLCEEGLIQIGSGKELFVLSFVIGAVENLDMLLDDNAPAKEVECYVKYSVFTHNITTDRVAGRISELGGSAAFNQRTSLRVAASLHSLAGYFAHCPHVVATVCRGDHTIGICSMDLRKLIPTEDTTDFVNKFCNSGQALTIHERCFILRCSEQATSKHATRRPYVDVEMSLTYKGLRSVKKPTNLTARSATQLETVKKIDPIEKEALDYKSGSCTNFDRDVGGVSYTNMGPNNTARYKTASGDSVLQTNEIAELIKKMCDSFTQNQEKLLQMRPHTSDVQVQCERDCGNVDVEEGNCDEEKNRNIGDTNPVKLEASKSDTCVCQHRKKEYVNSALSSGDRDQIMQKFVNELEDWKEKQQELFKYQLKRKEEYHLEMLSKEWNKKRSELESKLAKGIEQCRNLASDLSRATEDFRLRGYRNTERERKLLDAKKALESHYTAKYQELREASQKMEDDMNHRLKLKDMTIEEVQLKIQHTEKQVDVLKNNMKNSEKEADNRYSGLTKDQTASLIQELRCLEEKLDSAVQSKAFFKEQWGRAVRELHLIKLNSRRQMLSQLQQDRRQLGEMGLDTIVDNEDLNTNQNPVDIKKLKDDFYVDLLANSPNLDSNTIISTTGPGGIDMFDDPKNMPKNPMNERINELISQRDSLIQNEDPNEDLMKQLNHEIRHLLLNCGT